MAAAAVLALAALARPVAASEAGGAAPAAEAAAATTSSAAPIPVYFGNGCFWGRQYDFAMTEVKALGRPGEQISAVVGYAGGRSAGPDGKVCYYYAPKPSVYEKLGHAEVVQVQLQAADMDAAKRQFSALADTYFSQFRKTRYGMMRLDPQDQGPGYRNVIGIPGGMDSPLFPMLQAANKNGMALVRGQGNDVDALQEGDELNTVYVLDSDKLPFHRAEVYHQFHNGIGKAFPSDYTDKMKRQAQEQGRIGPTGCPEYFFF